MREQFSNLTATTAATLAESIDSANERALGAVVDANRKLVEFAVTTADRVAERINFELPFADRLPTLPTPAVSGERYLDFVERAVAVNREFNDRIVAMLKSDTVTVDTIVAKISKTVDETADQVNDAASAVTASVKQSAKRTATKAGARTAPARKAATKRSVSPKTTAKRTAKKAATTTAGAATTAKRTAKKSASSAAAATPSAT